MRVAVFGLGYVGSVTAACLADLGHEVVGVDVDPGKREAIARGRAPVSEDGLDEVIARTVADGSFRVSADAASAVAASDVSLVCVGTPSRPNGALDTTYVERVVEQIADAVRPQQHHVIVVRSTILPGTSRDRLMPIIDKVTAQAVGVSVEYAVNPEFMREGTAIRDFHKASFTVIGSDSTSAIATVEEMYAGTTAPVAPTSIEVAEMLKYTSNAFHALKVGFANEIGALAHAHGVDGRQVMELFCQDSVLNVSAAYLRPGFAFGGSCLPKDTKALSYRARQADVETPVLDSIMQTNAAHVRRAISAVEAQGRKRVLVLGLSFKSGTDDVRESPYVTVIEALIGRGYEVAVHDPDVDLDRLIGLNKMYIDRELPHVASILVNDLDAAVAEAEIVVVGKKVPGLGQALKNTRPDQLVLDLVGAVSADIPARCDALCW